MSERGGKPSALVIVSSSCQLFSGTGTALFDWIRHASRDIAFTLLVDTGERINFEAAARFCLTQHVTLIASEAEQMPGCPDNRPLRIAQVLRSQPWDMVECVSWASAATNMDVLANLPPATLLLYTPHTQPMWTLDDPARFFMVQQTLHRMIDRSDLVMIDTPVELDDFPRHLVDSARVLSLPLGVDTVRFTPGAPVARQPSSPRILVVADFREHRKRPDLLLRVLELVLQASPDIRPVLAGRGSDQLALPSLMATAAECLGFVTADRLLHEYQSAHVLLLLSDYEAFGLPIAEALCCGTPVVIHDQKETVSIFAGLPGVHVVPNTDTLAIRDKLVALSARPPDRSSIAEAAASRFSIESTYGSKLAKVLALLS